MIDIDKIIAYVEVENYLEQVMISKKRMAKYLKKSDKIPKKYQNDSFGWINDTLHHLPTKTKVVKNVRTVGKAKYHKISGNEIISGINYNLRSKILKELKMFFYDKLKHIKPLKEDMYPIGIKIEIYKQIGSWDIDNYRLMYAKAIHDALAGNVDYIKTDTGRINKNNKPIYKHTPDYDNYPPIIIDDCTRYVQETSSRVYDIEGDENIKMNIILYKL